MTVQYPSNEETKLMVAGVIMVLTLVEGLVIYLTVCVWSYYKELKLKSCNSAVDLVDGSIRLEGGELRTDHEGDEERVGLLSEWEE